MRYIRKKGFYGRKSGAYLVLYPYSIFTPIVLHPGSVLLYSLVDGQKSKEEVIQSARSVLHESSIPADEELTNAFDQLIRLGLIERNYSETLPTNFISVAFRGFWDGFDIDRNFFLEALTTHFIPIIVNSSHEEPSVIFIADEGSVSGYDHLTQENISIGVHTKSSNTDSDNSFDLNIYTYDDGTGKEEIVIPLWALHFNWISNYTNKTPDHHLFELVEFSPKKLGNKIYSFLDTYYKEYKQEEGAVNFWAIDNSNPARITNYNSILKNKLTIGMATYDDFDGVYFTIQSLRMYHSEVMDKVEFLLIDNHPGGQVSDSLIKLAEAIPNLKYKGFSEFNGTSSRDIIFRLANTEYVMCIDSHILIEQGAIKKLLTFLDENQGSLDLLQGPIVYDGLENENFSSSFTHEWRGGMYGTWMRDMRAADIDSPPFPIPMQGLGLFACRKDAWLGLNPRFRGFGGEEGYLHEKFRLAGRQTICLPFLRWLHRFGRPNGTLYPNLWLDRVRNYYIGFNEIGWDTASIDLHFAEKLGQDQYSAIQTQVTDQLDNPLYYFDAVYLLIPPKENESYEAIMDKLEKSGMSYFFRLYHYEITPDGVPTYERTSEKIVDAAIQYGFSNVMIVQDKIIFSKEFIDYLQRILTDIEDRDWKSLHIGSDIRNNYISIFDKSLYLPPINRPPNSHIAAYNLEYVYELAYLTKDTVNTSSISVIEEAKQEV